MSKGLDLSPLFDLRKNFTIIALTGRHGSGYQDIADQLSQGFNSAYENPDEFDLKNNSYRKYEIIYRFAKENLEKYTVINYKDLLTLYLLTYTYGDLVKYLNGENLKEKLRGYDDLLKASITYRTELKKLEKLKSIFQALRNTLLEFDLNNLAKSKSKASLFCSFFFGKSFRSFSQSFHDIFKSRFFLKHNVLIETISSNIRKSGNPYHNSATVTNPKAIFSIAELLNQIIKSIRIYNQNNPTKIVIDSMRVPAEIMYFKQRYSAFYLIAVNKEDRLRERNLEHYYKNEYESIRQLLDDEYKGGDGRNFFKQYLRECIEKADIHITHRSSEEASRLNKNRTGATSPYYSWRMQLLKYVSLIEHPGLVSPSPEERCMQLAYTAKYNSGCISRQVGAAITDDYYSVKAIGWNNTPEGQVPCQLRNAEVLLNASGQDITREISKERRLEKGFKVVNINEKLNAFTLYEKADKDFKNALVKNFGGKIEDNRDLLKGRNVCFCFKSIKNSYSEGKNQVHTRSLHAEESAFLQITKYGGQGIKSGKLFSTASPCELCAKKAYQLGIEVIYYVDPYPGISKDQVLSVGANRPELRLFNGAVGNSYTWLYEPLMPYKEELSFLLDQNIQDLATTQKKTINSLRDLTSSLLDENRTLTEQLNKHKVAKRQKALKR